MSTQLTARAGVQAYDRLLTNLSFEDFLDFVKLRSDAPLNPTITSWLKWDYLMEQARAWANGASEIDLKDRQLGYSWLVAAYSVWRARGGAAVALISKGQLESRELLSKCAFVERYLPAHLQDRPVARVDDIRYRSGGSVMAFPSTPDAGVSFTFQLVIMDEAHFHAYAAENYAAIRPTLSAGGQFIALSTADPSMGPNGWFPSIYWASKHGDTEYAARFVPWHVRPGRDREWLEKERRAFVGLPEAFDAYYAETDAEAFVARSGLVYPQFTEARHVKQAPFAIQDARRVVAGVDFGGGDPTAVVVLAMDGSQRIHQFAEFYERGAVGADRIGGFLSQFPHLGAVMCDPSQGTAIATLVQTFGLPAQAADNRRGDGMGLVSFLLDNDRLTIEPDNRHSIEEFPGYRWREATDPSDKQRYQTKTPVDHHADAMDARRYACAEMLAMLMPHTELPYHAMGGRPLARKAV
jgi:hypothetical protein